MAVFASKINTSSETFLRQRKEMLELVDRLLELNSRGRAVSEKRKPRFDARGQLTPRERLARLLDPGMPFLEIGNIAGYMVDTKDEAKSIPGSTVIAGIGFISGVRCMVVVDDRQRVVLPMIVRCLNENYLVVEICRPIHWL